MGVTPPGWYEDQSNPTLARWWDGDRWTEHTLVIAEQTPNVQPPPPPGYAQGAGSDAFLTDEDEGWNRLEDDPWRAPRGAAGASVFAAGGAGAAGAAERGAGPDDPPWEEGGSSEPTWDPGTRAEPSWNPDAGPDDPAATSVFAFDADEPVYGESWDVPADPHPDGRRGLADQYRDLPPWAQLALPAAIVLLVLVAVAAGALGGGGGGGSDGDDGTTTTVFDPVRLRSAALVASQAADVPSLTTSTFTELIPMACEAASEDNPNELVDEIEQLGLDDPTTDRLLVGLEAGAEDYCPADMSSNPGLIEELYTRLGVVPSGTTVPTTSSTTSTTAAPTTSTTARATTTTRRPTTTAAPTTTQPPTTTTQPPTTTTEPPTTTTTEPTDGGA